MGEIFAKAILPVLAVAGLLWWRGEQRDTAKREARESLVAACAGERECLGVVDRWYDLCFTNAWSGGTRRVQADLGEEALAKCLNEHARQPLFEVVDGRE